MCYLGARAVLSKPAQQANRISDGNLERDYISTLILTITNPLTILSFAAFFASLGGTSVSNYGYAGLFVTGVFLGSVLWWTLLATVVGVFIHKFDAKKLRWVNTISGMVIIGFGVYFLLSLFKIF